MSILSKLFQPKTPNGILCPHCERPLGAEHDEAHCQRRMSRRFFFGAALGGVVAAAAAPVVIPEILKIAPRPNGETWVAQWTDGPMGWEKVEAKAITVQMMFQGDPAASERFSTLFKHCHFGIWAFPHESSAGGRYRTELRETKPELGKVLRTANWVTLEKE